MFVITRFVNLYRKLKTAPRALPSSLCLNNQPYSFNVYTFNSYPDRTLSLQVSAFHKDGQQVRERVH